MDGTDLRELSLRDLRELITVLFQQPVHYNASVADSAEHAYRMLDTQNIDAVLLDLKLPGTGGLQALHQIRERRPDAVVVVVTGYGTVQSAVQAMKKRRIRLCNQTVQHGGTTTVAGPGVCAPEAQE